MRLFDSTYDLLQLISYMSYVSSYPYSHMLLLVLLYACATNGPYMVLRGSDAPLRLLLRPPAAHLLHVLRTLLPVLPYMLLPVLTYAPTRTVSRLVPRERIVCAIVWYCVSACGTKGAVARYVGYRMLLRGTNAPYAPTR